MPQSYLTALPRIDGNVIIARALSGGIAKGTLVSLVDEGDDALVVTPTNAGNLYSYLGVVQVDFGDGTVSVTREGLVSIEGGIEIADGADIYIDANGGTTTNRKFTNICIGKSTGAKNLPRYNVALHAPINDVSAVDFDAADAQVKADVLADLSVLETSVNNLGTIANDKVSRTDWLARQTVVDSRLDALDVLNADNLALISDNGRRISELEGNLVGQVTSAMIINSPSKLLSITGTTVNVAPNSTVSITCTDNIGTVFKLPTVQTDADGNYSATSTLDALSYGNVTATISVTDIYGNLVSSNDTENYAYISGLLEIDNASIDSGWGTVSLTGTAVDYNEGELLTLTATDGQGGSVTATTLISNGTFDFGVVTVLGSLARGMISLNLVTQDIYGNNIYATEQIEYLDLIGQISIMADVMHDSGKYYTANTGGELLYGLYGNNQTKLDGALTHRLVLKDKNDKEIVRTPTVANADGTAIFEYIDITGLAYGEITATVTARDIYNNEVGHSKTNTFVNVGATTPSLEASIDEGNPNRLSFRGIVHYVPTGVEVDVSITNLNNGRNISVKANTTAMPIEAPTFYHRYENPETTFVGNSIDVTSLEEGTLRVEFTVTDEFGREATIAKDVVYEPPGIIGVNFSINDQTGIGAISGSLTRVAANSSMLAIFYNASNQEVKRVTMNAGAGSYSKTGIDLSSAPYGNTKVVVHSQDIYGNAITGIDYDRYDDTRGSYRISSGYVQSGGDRIVIRAEWSNITSINVKITDSEGYIKNMSYASTADSTGYDTNYFDISDMAFGNIDVVVTAVKSAGGNIVRTFDSTYEDYHGELEIVDFNVEYANTINPNTKIRITATAKVSNMTDDGTGSTSVSFGVTNANNTFSGAGASEDVALVPGHDTPGLVTVQLDDTDVTTYGPWFFDGTTVLTVRFQDKAGDMITKTMSKVIPDPRSLTATELDIDWSGASLGATAATSVGPTVMLKGIAPKMPNGTKVTIGFDNGFNYYSNGTGGADPAEATINNEAWQFGAERLLITDANFAAYQQAYYKRKITANSIYARILSVPLGIEIDRYSASSIVSNPGGVVGSFQSVQLSADYNNEDVDFYAKVVNVPTGTPYAITYSRNGSPVGNDSGTVPADGVIREYYNGGADGNWEAEITLQDGRGVTIYGSDTVTYQKPKGRINVSISANAKNDVFSYDASFTDYDPGTTITFTMRDDRVNGGTNGRATGDGDQQVKTYNGGVLSGSFSSYAYYWFTNNAGNYVDRNGGPGSDTCVYARGVDKYGNDNTYNSNFIYPPSSTP